jgi:hypothetical protein
VSLGAPSLDPAPASANLLSILKSNLRANPFLQNFKCVLELAPSTTPLAVLPGSVVDDILKENIARGPLKPIAEDLVPHVLALLTDERPLAGSQAPKRNTIFEMGTLHTRQERLCPRPSSSSQPQVRSLALLVCADGLPDCSFDNLEGGSKAAAIILKTALFPFLFPHGRGAYDGVVTLCSYLKLRAQNSFSIFTLHKLYLLMMYQLRQTVVLSNSFKQSQLERAICKFREEYPKACEEDVFKHVIKHDVPGSLPASPEWHRNQLQDLLAMVEAWGLPSLFVTFTADGISKTRWSEIDDVEKLLKRMNKNFTWQDAPVEGAALFHARLQSFLKKYIFSSAEPLLGKVLHHVIRYEEQGRSSVHAHVILWIDSSDIDKVTVEICATIPGDFDETIGKFVAPTDPLQYALFELVINKMQHKCRADGCLKGGKVCKYGFPVLKEHPDECASFNPGKSRREYFRPRPIDRINTVPYHPIVLLLWGAHCNVLRITSSSWSYYVLKYAVKCEPAERLCLDVEAAKRLGIHGVSDSQLKVIAALTMSKPLSATTVALTMLGIDTIMKSQGVSKVSSAPPALRMRFISSCRQIYIPLVDKYCARPSCLSNLTFVDYFKYYQIERRPLQSKPLIGRDGLGNFVYANADQFKLVRSTDYHPAHHAEAYSYNVLMQKIPFRSVSELLSPVQTNPSQSYFVECVLKGIISEVDDLEAHVAEYASRQLWRFEQRQQIIDLILQNYPIDELPIPGHFLADFEPCDSIQPTSIEKDTLEMLGLVDEFSSMAEAVLTADQSTVFENLQKANGIHLLSGAPGAGKTFLTQYLTHKSRTAGKKVLLLATTGSAAIRLSRVARTVHSAFKIPHDGRPLAPMFPTDPLFEAILTADIIVIDEMSMLTSYVLSLIMYRLGQIVGSPELALESKLVLLVGDHAQLPTAVCSGHNGRQSTADMSSEDKDEICFQCHISNSIW